MLGAGYYSDPSVPAGAFIGKRFVQPKFFKGSDFVSLFFNSAAVGASFAQVTTASASYRRIVGYAMNAPTADLTTAGTNAFYNVHTYTSASGWISNARIWGYSYGRMNPIPEIRVNKSSTLYQHSFSIPTVCIAYDSTFDNGSGIGAKKTQWLTKYFGYTTPVSHYLSDTSLSGYSMSGANGTFSAFYSLSGALPAGVSEGTYYMMFRAST